MEGRIGVDGVDLTYLNLPVEETFFRMLRNHEFDACEMSLSSYVLSLFEEPQPFIAIPVFPSRFFRHSCIFVNSSSEEVAYGLPVIVSMPGKTAPGSL